MSITDTLKMIGREAVAVFAIEALKLSDLVTSDNEIVNAGKMGLIWSVASDFAEFLDTQQSHAMNGDYLYYVDETFFNSALYLALEKSGVGIRLGSQLNQYLPFSPMINNSVITGCLKVSGKVLAEMLNRSYPQTNLLTHVSLLWNNRS